MKKFIAVVLAVISIFGVMAVSAYAYGDITITCPEPTIGSTQVRVSKMTVTDSDGSSVTTLVGWYVVPASETVDVKTYNFTDDKLMKGTYEEGYQYVLNVYFATDVENYKAPSSVKVNGNKMEIGADGTYYYNFGEAKEGTGTDTTSGLSQIIAQLLSMLGPVIKQIITSIMEFLAISTTTVA